MKLITDVIYDEKPKDVTVFDTSVYVIKSCKQITVEQHEKHEEPQVKFQCDVNVYETSEYIDMIQKDNALLNEQVTQNQIALAEVYELVLSGSATV